MARNIYKRILDIDFQRDWWVGLGPALRDEKNLKYIFPVSGIFPGKADRAIVVLRMYYKATKFNKKHWSHFWKFFLHFFLYQLPLILGLGGKLKKQIEIFTWKPYIYRIWMRSVDWFRLYIRQRSHRQTDTHRQTDGHTHTHTDIFSKTHF